jgi:hypothetical protein
MRSWGGGDASEVGCFGTAAAASITSFGASSKLSGTAFLVSLMSCWRARIKASRRPAALRTRASRETASNESQAMPASLEFFRTLQDHSIIDYRHSRPPRGNEKPINHPDIVDIWLVRPTAQHCFTARSPVTTKSASRAAVPSRPRSCREPAANRASRCGVMWQTQVPRLAYRGVLPPRIVPAQ